MQRKLAQRLYKKMKTSRTTHKTKMSLLLLLLACTSYVCSQSICKEASYTFNDTTELPTGLTADYNSANVDISNGLVSLILDEETGGTRISVDNYFQYGTVESTMKIAAGSNVVTAFILMADNGDEIDFEFVGKDTKEIQTNWFYKGKPIYNVHAAFFRVNKDLATSFNTFAINWTPEYYEWKVNGRSLRKFSRNDTTDFPDSPSKIQIGIWNAGPSKWAGPGVNWKDAPFAVQISSIAVKCGETPPDSANRNLPGLFPPAPPNASVPAHCQDLYP